MAKLESVLDQVLKHLGVQSRDYTTINTTTHHPPMRSAAAASSLLDSPWV